MKKFIILTVSILLIIHSSTYCQTTTFEYLLTTPSNEVINDIYEASDGFIYGVGFVTKPNEYSFNANGFILKLDEEGIFVDSCILNKNKRFCFDNILPENDNQFVLSGYSSDTINGWPNNEACSIELKKINSNLEILSEKTFSFPPDYGYWNMLTRRGKNNDLLIGGSIFPYNIPYIYFYVIDDQFDSIKADFYVDSTRTCYAIHQVTDSSYWLIDGIRPDYYTMDNNAAYDYLSENHGSFDSAKMIELSKIVATKNGNLENVVYDATNLEMWVAYAHGNEAASSRPYVHIDLKEYFK